MLVSVERDLRCHFGAPRDQGTRPTCLAFAASDFHAALRGGWIPLSCEFAFYHAQRRGRRKPTEGADLASMLDALREDGQPVETDWPYLANLPSDPSAWLPPIQIGRRFRRCGARRGVEFQEVIEILDEGSPALILMTLSDSFYLPRAGGVVNPPPSETVDPTRRHAVVAVGHGLADGDSVILIRNSWGGDWGLEGHAWLPRLYLEPRLLRLAVLTEEIDALDNSTSA
jgi:hypothetical protein